MGCSVTPLGKKQICINLGVYWNRNQKRPKAKSVSLNHLGFFCGYGVRRYTEVQSRPSSNNLTYVCTFSASLLSNYLEVGSGERYVRVRARGGLRVGSSV